METFWNAQKADDGSWYVQTTWHRLTKGGKSERLVIATGLSEPNARVIAAAHDLHGVLRQLVGAIDSGSLLATYDDKGKTARRLIALLAHIEGRPDGPLPRL